MSDHVELGRVANTYESKQADCIPTRPGMANRGRPSRRRHSASGGAGLSRSHPRPPLDLAKGKISVNTPGAFRIRPAHRRGLKVSTLLVVCSRSRATRRLRRAGLRDNNESLELALAFQFGATCEKITVA